MGDPCEVSEVGSSLVTKEGGVELCWLCSEGAWSPSSPRVVPLASWGPTGGSLTEVDCGSGVRRGAVKGQHWPERQASLSPAVGTAPLGLHSGMGAMEGR